MPLDVLGRTRATLMEASIVTVKYFDISANFIVFGLGV